MMEKAESSAAIPAAVAVVQEETAVGRGGGRGGVKRKQALDPHLLRDQQEGRAAPASAAALAEEPATAGLQQADAATLQKRESLSPSLYVLAHGKLRQLLISLADLNPWQPYVMRFTRLRIIRPNSGAASTSLSPPAVCKVPTATAAVEGGVPVPPGALQQNDKGGETGDSTIAEEPESNKDAVVGAKKARTAETGELVEAAGCTTSAQETPATAAESAAESNKAAPSCATGAAVARAADGGESAVPSTATRPGLFSSAFAALQQSSPSSFFLSASDSGSSTGAPATGGSSSSTSSLFGGTLFSAKSPFLFAGLCNTNSLFPAAGTTAAAAAATAGLAAAGSSLDDASEEQKPEEPSLIEEAANEDEDVLFTDRDCRMQRFDTSHKTWTPKPPLDGKVQVVASKKDGESLCRIVFFVHRTGKLQLNTPLFPNADYHAAVDKCRQEHTAGIGSGYAFSGAAKDGSSKDNEAQAHDAAAAAAAAENRRLLPRKLNTAEFLGLKLDAESSKDTTLYRVRFGSDDKCTEFLQLVNEKKKQGRGNSSEGAGSSGSSAASGTDDSESGSAAEKEKNNISAKVTTEGSNSSIKEGTDSKNSGSSPAGTDSSSSGDTVQKA